MAETRTNGLAEGASAAASPPSGGSVMRTTPVQASNEWWQQLDQRIYQCIKLWVEQWYPPERDALTDAVGQGSESRRCRACWRALAGTW